MILGVQIPLLFATTWTEFLGQQRFEWSGLRPLHVQPIVCALALVAAFFAHRRPETPTLAGG